MQQLPKHIQINFNTPIVNAPSDTLRGIQSKTTKLKNTKSKQKKNHNNLSIDLDMIESTPLVEITRKEKTSWLSAHPFQEFNIKKLTQI